MVALLLATPGDTRMSMFVRVQTETRENSNRPLRRETKRAFRSTPTFKYVADRIRRSEISAENFADAPGGVHAR